MAAGQKNEAGISTMDRDKSSQPDYRFAKLSRVFCPSQWDMETAIWGGNFLSTDFKEEARLSIETRSFWIGLLLLGLSHSDKPPGRLSAPNWLCTLHSPPFRHFFPQWACQASVCSYKINANPGSHQKVYQTYSRFFDPRNSQRNRNINVYPSNPLSPPPILPPAPSIAWQRGKAFSQKVSDLGDYFARNPLHCKHFPLGTVPEMAVSRITDILYFLFNFVFKLLVNGKG